MLGKKSDLNALLKTLAAKGVRAPLLLHLAGEHPQSFELTAQWIVGGGVRRECTDCQRTHHDILPGQDHPLGPGVVAHAGWPRGQSGTASSFNKQNKHFSLYLSVRVVRCVDR
jgi:hypothetical protein